MQTTHGIYRYDQRVGAGGKQANDNQPIQDD